MGVEAGVSTAGSGLGAIEVRRWSTSDFVVLVLFSLAAAGLRLLFIEQWSFGPSEATTWRALTAPLYGEGETFAASGQVAYPLAFLLMRELLEQGVLPGMTEGWLRLPFAFAGCLVTPLLALLARPLLGREVGILAALVVAFHPACIASSQTADPVVVASAIALLAGVLAMRGWKWSSGAAVVLAGGSHPLGWVAGLGILCAVRQPRWLVELRWRWVGALALAAAPVFVDLGYGPTWTSVLLSLLAVGLWLPRARGFALAAMLPLASAGIWWWWDPAVGASARVITAPVIAALASWACVQFARAVAGGLDASPRVKRLVLAAPVLILLAELFTATFLYFTVYEGGRSAWRSARSAVAASRVPGRELVVIAGRGAEVLRTYLRPSHWREPGRDPHPGIRVEPLAGDAAGRAAQALRADALFVLLPEERVQLGSAADDLVVVALWPSPKAVGDASLSVLRRRAQD